MKVNAGPKTGCSLVKRGTRAGSSCHTAAVPPSRHIRVDSFPVVDPDDMIGELSLIHDPGLAQGERLSMASVSASATGARQST